MQRNIAAACETTRNVDGGFYKCEECSKGFNRMASYEAHIRMHAQDELDAYDIVFNYAGRIHEQVATSSNPRRERQNRQKVSPTLNNLRRSPNSALHQSSSTGTATQSQCTAALLQSQNPGTENGSDIKPPKFFHALNGSAEANCCNPLEVTTSPYNGTADVKEMKNARSKTKLVSSSEKCESLIVRVPLKILSSEVFRRPVINLTKQEHTSNGSLKYHVLSGSGKGTSSTEQMSQLEQLLTMPNMALALQRDVSVSCMDTVTQPVPGLLNESKKAPPKKQKRTKQSAEQSVMCPVCDRSFSSTYGMKRHFSVHTEKPFKCKDCDKAFNQPHNLERHAMYHHKFEAGGSVSSSPSSPDKDKALHTCKVCNKKFSHFRLFKNHLTSHDTDRRYKCDTCHMRFKRPQHLECHAQTHTQEKNSICHLCNKRFYRPHHLERHMRLHLNEEAYTNAVTGEVMYICKYCPKVCRTASGLSKHHTVHKAKEVREEVLTMGEKEDLHPEKGQEVLVATDTETETETETKGNMVIEKRAEEKKNEGDLESDSVFPESGLSEEDSEWCEEMEGGELSDGEDTLSAYSDVGESSSSDTGGGRRYQRSFKCEWCGRVFLKRRYLTKHYQIHQQVPHQCGQCGKVFMSLNYLKRHVQTKHRKN